MIEINLSKKFALHLKINTTYINNMIISSIHVKQLTLSNIYFFLLQINILTEL